MSDRGLKRNVNDFKRWFKAMGYNERQVMMAAGTIGITGASIASGLSTGRRDLTETERLAMSAARIGLKPWSPEYDDELTAAFQGRSEASAA